MNKTKPKVARVLTTDAQIDAAIAFANEYDAYRPKMERIAYDFLADAIVIDLIIGVRLSVPRRLIAAVAEELPDVAAKVIAQDDDMGWWPDLDDGFSLHELLADISGEHGAAVIRGKLGGPSRSPKKAAAARRNGRKGGRPKALAPYGKVPA